MAAHTIEPLPPGAVVPALAATEHHRRAGGRPRDRAGARRASAAVPRRVALVIPDTVAQGLAGSVREDSAEARAICSELVRWQIKKTAPFPLEQAVVSFTPGAPPREGGQEFVVAVARQDIIEQYEQACARAGVHAGLVDLATFSIVNGVLGESDASRRATGCWCT